MDDLFVFPFDFIVIPVGSSYQGQEKNIAVLKADGWDDWGKFRTQFHLRLIDKYGNNHNIGDVKIGQIGLKPHIQANIIPPDHRFPNLAPRFQELDSFFSLGQDAQFYENLSRISGELRSYVLKSLKDVAFDPYLWEQTKHEEVMVESLLRTISNTEVEGQLRRLSSGLARLTIYRFSYTPPQNGECSPAPQLAFSVYPGEMIPSNVHVLIGRNGVGKTHLINGLLRTIANGDEDEWKGEVTWVHAPGMQSSGFANIVNVSFSAFDSIGMLSEDLFIRKGMRYTYIGLRQTQNEESAPGTQRSTLKSFEELAVEFAKSIASCAIGDRKRRWEEAVEILTNDIGLNDAGLPLLMRHHISPEERYSDAMACFGKLSSGHKVVLLTMTRLVETVEEKTLILFDEPECHLHPPLLSAFIRALSNLLSDRNGVAIIATHSPVVLQEVPKECVWKITKIGNQIKAERPSVETFGENVGLLTHETFRLELETTGFYSVLERIADSEPNYDSAVRALGGALGHEAKAVLSAIYYSKNSGGVSNL